LEPSQTTGSAIFVALYVSQLFAGLQHSVVSWYGLLQTLHESELARKPTYEPPKGFNIVRLCQELRSSQAKPYTRAKTSGVPIFSMTTGVIKANTSKPRPSSPGKYNILTWFPEISRNGISFVE
jgi:hypothetical protein